VATGPEQRSTDGDGGSSDDDRQPDDAGQTGTLGEIADDRPVPGKPAAADDASPKKRRPHRSGDRATGQKSRSATSDQRSR
jgi:hypothetical protein